MATENNGYPVRSAGSCPGKNKRNLLFFLLIFFFFSGIRVFSCTVFYVSWNGISLGGNNEDWSDPKTLMIFVAPAENKYGWIKFGFKSGFPQGGMNEYGLFWDATAVPFLDMPVSVANKIKYTGPLMKKIMEECKTIADALKIFEKYYCDDQFEAQYLIGDRFGSSVIVEGDGYILKKNRYQIMTNFYHSFPSLGGYPCERYEAAKKILDKNTALDIPLIINILESTHQEGKYPTQYSNIYNSVESSVYLFYYHNFSEYIKITLDQNSLKRNTEIDIPLLFSNIDIIFPVDRQKINTIDVNFEWYGKPDSIYELVYSLNEDLSECITIPIDTMIASVHILKISHYHYFLFGFLLIGYKNRSGYLIRILLILIALLLFTECRISDDVLSTETQIRFSHTISSLETGVNYFWKIRANTGNAVFSSETITRSFFINGEG